MCLGFGATSMQSSASLNWMCITMMHILIRDAHISRSSEVVSADRPIKDFFLVLPLRTPGNLRGVVLRDQLIAKLETMDCGSLM